MVPKGLVAIIILEMRLCDHFARVLLVRWTESTTGSQSQSHTVGHSRHSSALSHSHLSSTISGMNPKSTNDNAKIKSASYTVERSRSDHRSKERESASSTIFSTSSMVLSHSSFHFFEALRSRKSQKVSKLIS